MYKFDMTKLPAEKQIWFCNMWPDIAIGIKAISAVSKNLIVLGSCALLLAVGNALQKKICG